MFTRVFSGFPVEPFANAANDPALRSQLGLAPDAFVIGKIARLAAQRPRRFVHRLSKAAAPIPPARLLLVGDGRLRTQLEARARMLGLADKNGLYRTGSRPARCRVNVGIMDCLAHLSAREALSRAACAGSGGGQTGLFPMIFDGAGRDLS